MCGSEKALNNEVCCPQYEDAPHLHMSSWGGGGDGYEMGEIGMRCVCSKSRGTSHGQADHLVRRDRDRDDSSLPLGIKIGSPGQ